MKAVFALLETIASDFDRTRAPPRRAAGLPDGPELPAAAGHVRPNGHGLPWHGLPAAGLPARLPAAAGHAVRPVPLRRRQGLRAATLRRRLWGGALSPRRSQRNGRDA